MRIARLHFGSRVQAWHEGAGEYGHYGWLEVNAAFEAYEQPDEQEIPTSTAQSASETDAISELDLRLFSIQEVPGKGRGLIARFDIAIGKRILSEKPLFITPNMSLLNLMEESIALQLKKLPKTQQREFLSLHNNFPGKYPFSGIAKTNALPCGPGAFVGGVYPIISFINHSCLPNTHHSWNSQTECETIHAVRNITAGEEITICYTSGDDPFKSRQAKLKDSFGFICNCALCTLSPADLQESDTRRYQMKLIDAAIGDGNRVMKKPSESLADCRTLLQVLEEEHKGVAGPLIARLYYDAFQISITHGDQARASVFAERGYKARVYCEGEDSPETKNMKSLMEKPASHRNFGASNKWRIAKGMVPKGVGTDEFEKWLWKQQK